MKISKNSWHYKLNSSRTFAPDFVRDIVYYEQTTSLCVYFWLTVASLLKSTIAAAGFIVLVVLLLSMLNVLIFVPFLVMINVLWVNISGDILHSWYLSIEDMRFTIVLLMIYAAITVVIGFFIMERW